MNAASGRIAEVGMDAPGSALCIPIGLLVELGHCRTQDETLNCFARWSHKIVGADRCSVALPEEDQLVVTGLAGDRAIPTGTRVPVRGTFIGDVFARRESQRLGDLANQPYPDAINLAAAGMKTLMIAPLLAGGQCFGTLAFAFKSEHHEHLTRMAIIEALAQCLATQLLVIKQISALARLAETDPLTETFNRRYYYEISELLWKTWKSTGTVFSVASFDIDCFKGINDDHGHDVGDAVLKSVAACLRAHVREGDAVVRMGGEEFLLILRNCRLESATAIADRAKASIAESPVNVGELQVPVTASAGVAAAACTDGNLAELIKRADDALYQAKSDGRNRVVVCDAQT